MKKYILLLVAGLFSMASFAHNPDVSTTMLVEKENNVWVLQLSASLTAFQQEVRTHFADTPYKTPEEFQEMVLQHIKNNFKIRFNDDKNVTLSKGIVKLGHETKVVFEVSGVPTQLHSMDVTNTVFKDIYKSQSMLVILKENFEKKRFILNSDNNHTVSLKVTNKEFVEKQTQSASFFSSTMLFILIGGLGLGFIVQKIIKQKGKRVI